MPTVAQRYALSRAAACAQRPEAPAGPVVLMVSGGADSTALLVMACTSRLDIGDGMGLARIARERICVLHVNHHLRGAESDGDERFVRELCVRFGVPVCVVHASFTDLGGQNLEAAAREARYAAARRYARELCAERGCPRSAARIATAHTASDRTETFFMNAIKGSGLAGLSSIPRRRNIIVRPLIDRTHEELCRYLEVAGVGWREDATNDDTAYLRNFVRHRVVPVAAERNANLAHVVSASCDILGEEDAFMSQLAATALRACTRRSAEGLMVLDGARLAAAEVAIARRMVRLAVKQLDPEARLEMRHVEAVLACVAAGTGSLTLPAGIGARMEFGALSLRTAVAREELVAGWLTVPGRMPLANGAVLEASLERVPAGGDAVALARSLAAADDASTRTVLVDAAALGYAEPDAVRLKEGGPGVPAEALGARLWVDAPAPGDLMCPLGMHGRTKKVSDILGEEQVPVAERAQVPVVRTAPGASVVWVGGIRLDDRFKCTAASRVLVKLVIRRVDAV
ncbi:tRNA lysidine(34) synthetase TilS [Enorma burkinafasonensis]|uniref:tRNA lysidine(34) synthetase TilS n=1 Tax=Enorma burkinafasonensis TaxID=2590867 RepID=UPI0026F11179|nr:tRNA lysidine(34) synthetase TilS [Enorma burkinafasonensis]MCI7731098.1 tRNA lysidine(34) synthetase TilS [Enorma burkinafasonensis]